ncbi:MAG TPA: helix-turn-helix domain-containing protein [Pirellulaceae bacterium]|nr:helix-turn-helix domain-containing protein [Pirellulaceae bacterium]
MAGKFVDLVEAAKMIGVSAEGLVEMRSKGSIFGYRDGASWKFKVDEVERVIRERGVDARDSDSGILNANDDEFENMISGLSSKILADKAQEESEPGSVLISEQELGVSSTGHSTIIGKGLKQERDPSDSDLRLADDSGKDILGGGSDKLIEAPGDKIDLAGASDVLHGSDIHIKAGSGTGDMPVAKKAGSSGGLHLDDDLAISEDDDIGSSDSALDEEIRPGSKPGSSGKGSDVTLGSGDSGINLKPSDSGLSLEEQPLELGGGSGIESLELPEDDEVVALDTEAVEEHGSAVKADNEFLLSAGDTLDEDESDSGSQVIALEDSESFDQDAATMLKSEEGALAADAFQPMGGDSGLETAAPGMGTQPVYVQAPSTEAPYSVWNVLALGTVAGLLALSGMMMVDVMLNMWAFSEPSGVSTGIMDAFISMFNMG